MRSNASFWLHARVGHVRFTHEISMSVEQAICNCSRKGVAAVELYAAVHIGQVEFLRCRAC